MEGITGKLDKILAALSAMSTDIAVIKSQQQQTNADRRLTALGTVAMAGHRRARGPRRGRSPRVEPGPEMTIVDDIIALATAEIGSPYVYGDEGPDTFDCSGLVQYVYGLKGYKLPRTAAQQQKYVKPVTNPLPGDLVYWGDPAYHTAIYIGGGEDHLSAETGRQGPHD